jgi:hypothetical protein
MRLKHVFWSVANVPGGTVLVLFLVDPTRPLLPIFVLLSLAVVLTFLPALLSKK